MVDARRLLSALAVASAILVAGCASNPEGSVRLAPGETTEINVSVEAGQVLAWSWAAEGDLEFNVHRHVGGAVVYDVQMTAGSDRGEVRAEEDGVISMMWTNAGTSAIRLDYGYTASS